MIKKINNINSSENDVIANNVRKLMTIHNLSESELARALNVSVMTIRRVVSGETEDPRISTLNLIANYFKVSLDLLINETNLPISVLKNNKSQFVPIISWEMLEQFYSDSLFDLSGWTNWYSILDSHLPVLNEKAFALESKQSMQPRFPYGTLLIINQDETPLDNDLILIRSKSTKEFSLRELIVDTPKWILQPIIAGSEIIFFNKDEYDIIGVVLLTILRFRK